MTAVPLSSQLIAAISSNSGTILIAIAATFLFYTHAFLSKLLFADAPFPLSLLDTSALSELPGPSRENYILGNLGKVFAAEPGVKHQEWATEHGGALRYWGMFGSPRLLVTDPVALNHILLTRAYDYPKPNEVRGSLARILGQGVLFAEGEDHKRQRRIMNPAFSPSALRDITPTFFELSYKLRDKWLALLGDKAVDLAAYKDEEIAKVESAKLEEGTIVIEISKWMSRLTLDIIGLTGFGYDFHALDKEQNALASAFAGMMPSTPSKPSAYKFVIQQLLGRLITLIPALATYIPNKTLQSIRAGFLVMEEESRKIVEEKKLAVKEEGTGVGGGKDLITLLLKSNMTDAKNSMSDIELQGQMTTFILAGHETTSTALTWTLWTLSRHLASQSKLRLEIRTALRTALSEGRDELTADELSGLEYLDAVCREILRLESPVTATIRSSSIHDTVPLATPVKNNKTGKMMDSFKVVPGQTIFMSVTAVNKDKRVYGDDAEVFRPERWLEAGGMAGKGSGVGVWSGLLTFLAGPRACIGYKFALLELKAILLVLIDTFEFDERSPDLPIERRATIVMRPLIVGEEELGFRMPLRVKSAARE